MFKILWLAPVLFLTACFHAQQEPDVTPTPPEPVYTEGERPDFEPEIDEDEAFNAVLDAVPSTEIPRFVEVIDEGDADAMAPRSEAEIEALMTDEDRAAQARYEAQELARAQNKTGQENRGLEVRQYSPALYDEVVGLRSALVYFTAEDCESCKTWEEELRKQADDFAELNTLIIMVDFNAEPDLAKSLTVTAPGQAMFATPIGELLGPRKTEHLKTDDLLLMFQ